MTPPLAPGARSALLRLFLLGAAATGILALGLRECGALRRDLLAGMARTSLTQGLVIERVRDVAKLVSTEVTVRDVVTYENTYFGSTKKSLIVVTGKLLAGIDLADGAAVAVDGRARRITITLPHARLLGVDVINLNTYDEQRGLWNPFHPSDRDEIYRLVRRQLERAGDETRVAERADESARHLLSALFAADGYTTQVVFRSRVATASDSAAH